MQSTFPLPVNDIEFVDALQDLAPNASDQNKRIQHCSETLYIESKQLSKKQQKITTGSNYTIFN